MAPRSTCRLVLALAIVLVARAAAEEDEEAEDLISQCRIDEFACEDGVLVEVAPGEEQCWRVGGQGQSCDDVCGIAPMVDTPGTILGSGVQEVISCLEEFKMPGIKE